MSQAPDFAALREQMCERQLRKRGLNHPRVLDAMGRVPREEFVAERRRPLAYDDRALPSDCGQTISQPYIVALMTAALDPQPTDRVLDVGTGSGYQTAILAELAAEVLTIERHRSLAEGARRRLQKLGYRNVRYLVGDGTVGFAEAAPYDGILVAATAPKVPPALFAQLAEGGRLVIPVGPEEGQTLQLIHKRNGQPQAQPLTSCRFVPLVGKQGWEAEPED